MEGQGRPVISLWLTRRFLACSCAHEQPVRNDFFPSPRSCSGASVSLHPHRRRSNNTVVLVDRPAAALPLRASSRRRFAIDCPRAPLLRDRLFSRRRPDSGSLLAPPRPVEGLSCVHDQSWLPVRHQSVECLLQAAPPAEVNNPCVVLPVGFIDAIVR
jgi:hypothetical protein